MQSTSTRKHFYDPRRGHPALTISPVRFGRQPVSPPRTNRFSVYSIEQGSGTLWADSAQHEFCADSLIFFVPYQYIRFEPARSVRGQVVHFHANFLCVETFHAEVGCAGMLFNDPYGSPAVRLDEAVKADVRLLLDRIDLEQQEAGLAHDEVMLASLRVLLILASRLKSADNARCSGDDYPRHPVIAPLRELIETHYTRLHSPSDYAKLLHMTPKTLGRIVREELGLTLTDLIRQRLLTHAKWELLHTLKPVKQVARELGFSDELYFSRLFKKATGCSPTFFREFETEIRGGSNLSMLSDDPSIHPHAQTAET